VNLVHCRQFFNIEQSTWNKLVVVRQAHHNFGAWPKDEGAGNTNLPNGYGTGMETQMLQPTRVYWAASTFRCPHAHADEGSSKPSLLCIRRSLGNVNNQMMDCEGGSPLVESNEGAYVIAFVQSFTSKVEPGTPRPATMHIRPEIINRSLTKHRLWGPRPHSSDRLAQRHPANRDAQEARQVAVTRSDD
jgi:hypothetical protein